ncbi:hypothetical protein [Roseimicrobium gellanilyticum]|nr:hypothetical protein [Roseimicrobium gellanilyticum]
MQCFLTMLGILSSASGVHAEPDLTEVWSTQWIGLRMPVVQKGMASPSTDLDEKHLNPKASRPADENNDSVYWTGAMLLQTADKAFEVPKALRKKEVLEFSSMVWTSDKEEFRDVVGLAPANTFIVSDDETENEFWIIEVYGDEKGASAYLSVGYHCGANLYQQRMDTKFARITNQELIRSLITSGKETAK